MREGGVKNCQKKTRRLLWAGLYEAAQLTTCSLKISECYSEYLWWGVIQQLRGQNFASFYTLCVDKNIIFFDPPPPHLVHVVIEWPLCYIMLCLFYWFSERNLYKYGGKFPMFLQWRFYSIGLWRYLYWYWWVHSDTQYLWQWYLYQYFWFLPLSMFLRFSNEFGQ